MEETVIADHFKWGACGKLFDADGKQLQSGDLILDKLTEAPEAPKEPVNGTVIIVAIAAAAVLVGVCVVVTVHHKKRGSGKK